MSHYALEPPSQQISWHELKIFIYVLFRAWHGLNISGGNAKQMFVLSVCRLNSFKLDKLNFLMDIEAKKVLRELDRSLLPTALCLRLADEKISHFSVSYVIVANKSM